MKTFLGFIHLFACVCFTIHTVLTGREKKKKGLISDIGQFFKMYVLNNLFSFEWVLQKSIFQKILINLTPEIKITIEFNASITNIRPLVDQ